MRKFVTDEKLAEIVKQSISWSGAIKFCGSSASGASFQYYQSRIKRLGFDTSHFLGKASHTGFRHTGSAKKKHWSQILVERKTFDRESGKQFRRAYTEYCEENNVPIKCVECGNNGTWLTKKLKLEINHKNDCRWNNIPQNLEWICPNCHSIKTIY